MAYQLHLHNQPLQFQSFVGQNLSTAFFLQYEEELPGVSFLNQLSDMTERNNLVSANTDTSCKLGMVLLVFVQGVYNR